MARPRFDTEPTAPKIDLIEVGLENLLLGVVALHLARRRLLSEFARQPGGAADLVPVDDVGMHVSDELLRDRARTAAVFSQNLAFDRAEHTDHVDAVVLVEPLILDR